MLHVGSNNDAWFFMNLYKIKECGRVLLYLKHSTPVLNKQYYQTYSLLYLFVFMPPFVNHKDKKGIVSKDGSVFVDWS